ncbi:hypothetical protein ALMP_72510 [Streptomyces sp. A012304]|nr:hypothetical protein ALMP_72510 [Streptomyces sp. A012304]
MQGLSERHRRSSTGLTGWLRSIAIELGGRPAARLCRRLRLVAGRTRLLRLSTAPTVPDRAPRVMGVDEFAFRKGCTYGTVLVDVEAGRVVDVLPDRTSETFAAWLTEHPGAEIICRDRATAYTKAVKEAAPHALEVADRWHLLQNLSAAVEKTCHQHRDCLRKRAEEETVTEVLEPPPMLLPPQELPRTQVIERTRHRYEDIRLACPDITRACDLARACADMVRHQRGYLLLEWIRQAEQDAPKPMKGFASFLRQDFDAVTVGLTLLWSSGVVEGHVIRLKKLKRAMYGRASFELLRARILTRP